MYYANCNNGPFCQQWRPFWTLFQITVTKIVLPHHYYFYKSLVWVWHPNLNTLTPVCFQIWLLMSSISVGTSKHTNSTRLHIVCCHGNAIIKSENASILLEGMCRNIWYTFHNNYDYLGTQRIKTPSKLWRKAKDKSLPWPLTSELNTKIHCALFTIMDGTITHQ